MNFEIGSIDKKAEFTMILLRVVSPGKTHEEVQNQNHAHCFVLNGTEIIVKTVFYLEIEKEFSTAFPCCQNDIENEY